MAKTVVGLFDDLTGARNSLQELEAAGFKKNDIGLIANDADNWFTGRSYNDFAGNTPDTAGTVPGDGAARDITNFVSGFKTANLPGMGQVAVAGPLAGSADQNRFIDQLESMGVPDDDANFYAESIRRGDSLLEMQTDDNDAERCAEIMRRNGAIDIHNRFDFFRQSGFNRFDENAPGYTAEQIDAQRDQYAQSTTGAGNYPRSSMGTAAGEGVTIPVVEEKAVVDKQSVPADGVRVYNRVTEQPIDQDVTLRRETVTVDRQPADRPATAQDMQAFQEGVIDIPESSEEPIVDKQARVVEDVNINKNVTETTQPVHTTARRNEVDVENLNDDTLDEDANLNPPPINRQGY